MFFAFLRRRRAGAFALGSVGVAFLSVVAGVALAQTMPPNNLCCRHAHKLVPSTPEGAHDDCDCNTSSSPPPLLQCFAGAVGECAGEAWEIPVSGFCRAAPSFTCTGNSGPKVDVTIQYGDFVCEGLNPSENCFSPLDCDCIWKARSPAVEETYSLNDCAGMICGPGIPYP